MLILTCKKIFDTVNHTILQDKVILGVWSIASFGLKLSLEGDVNIQALKLYKIEYLKAQLEGLALNHCYF